MSAFGYEKCLLHLRVTDQSSTSLTLFLSLLSLLSLLLLRGPLRLDTDDLWDLRVHRERTLCCSLPGNKKDLLLDRHQGHTVGLFWFMASTHLLFFLSRDGTVLSTDGPHFHFPCSAHSTYAYVLRLYGESVRQGDLRPHAKLCS